MCVCVCVCVYVCVCGWGCLFSVTGIDKRDRQREREDFALNAYYFLNICIIYMTIIIFLSVNSNVHYL